MSETVAVATPGQDPFTVYDADGGCVGRVCRRTGRALIAGEFWQAVRGGGWPAGECAAEGEREDDDYSVRETVRPDER